MRPTTLPLAVLALSAQAQVNFPFPDSAATCAVLRDHGIALAPAHLRVGEHGELLHERLRHADRWHELHPALRLRAPRGRYPQDTGAVYFQPADSGTGMGLLYDFGVSMGDTLRDVYVNELLGTGTGGWMRPGGDVLRPQHELRRTHRGAGPSAGLGAGHGLPWVEGIGSIHGLFTLNPLNVSGWYGIHCMSHQDTVRWEEGTWFVNAPGPAVRRYVGIAEEAGPHSVYPNPTTGTMFVDARDRLSEIDEVRITDALGRTTPLSLAGRTGPLHGPG
ncbi:MAG: hypothetical protein R2810_04860 [Flavobacteriales bacterium]